MRSTRSRRLVALLLAFMTLTLAACTAKETKPADTASKSAEQKPAAPAYAPKGPVTIIAPSGAGGGWDTFARAISKVMVDEKLVNQALPVENRAGGSGATAMAWMQVNKKGADDTLVVFSPPLIINGVTAASPFTWKNLTPLARVISDYNLVLVRKDAPWKDLKEFLAALKADPSQIAIGGGSTPGGMDHVAISLIAKKNGMDISQLKYVSFQGGGEAMISMLGGHIQAVSTGVGEAIGQIEAGTVRALAITSSQRLGGKMKDVPTVKEQGLDVTYSIWRGVFGMPDMPADTKAFWQDALTKMNQTKGWKQVLTNQAWEDAFDTKGFEAFLAQEDETYTAILKDLGLFKK